MIFGLLLQFSQLQRTRFCLEDDEPETLGRRKLVWCLTREGGAETIDCRSADIQQCRSGCIGVSLVCTIEKDG
jgi:hypothetical protein